MRQEARFKNIRTTQYALLYNRLCSPVYTLSVKKRTLQAYFNPLKKGGEYGLDKQIAETGSAMLYPIEIRQ